MQNKKIIIFGVIILAVVSLIFWQTIFQKFYKTTPEEELILATKTAGNFENLLKNGINENNAENLLGYFSEDVLQQDKIYKNQILDDIKNKNQQLNFKVLEYKILEILKQENQKNFEVKVEETRDYVEKSADYGTKFLRVIILEKYKNDWKIKNYEKINNNNVYSGSLSGSRKYDGFYP